MGRFRRNPGGAARTRRLPGRAARSARALHDHHAPVAMGRHPMTALAPPAVRRPSCARLLSGCAFGALLAAVPSVAAAQALQGAGTIVDGAAALIEAPSFTQVEIGSAEVVIDWTPFDSLGTGTIDFLPVGATAEFTEVTGTFDFTVLNRIIPTDSSGIPV